VTAIVFPNWKDKIVFSPTGPQPQILLETEKSKALLAGLEPDQVIPEHPEGPSIYHFLEGKGWMVVDGERIEVGPGVTVATPAGAKRGMQAETRLAFLAVRMA
jgi:quercetin dioxygenase-like cupin family protein